MSIDPSYQHVYNKAQQLQNNIHDMLGTTDPKANVLRHEARELVNDLANNKDPQHIENRIKVIQNQMYQIEHQGANYMTYEHAHVIHNNYNQMRQDIHRIDYNKFNK